MSGWQPIDTAPKDGTPLDLWAVDIFTDGRPQEGGRYPDAGWHEGRWFHFDPIAGDNVPIEVEWSNGKTVATHWMPVPEGPDA